MRRDEGQTTAFMVAALGLVAIMLLVLGPAGKALTDRAQARTAADATALAGAAEGEEAARSLAAANGGDLVSYQSVGAEVLVAVEVSGIRAYARARRVSVPGPVFDGASPEGTGARAGLAPAMLAALERADHLLGEPVPVTSGFRDPGQQQALWDRRHLNPYPVAPPGTSMHERGLAIDVPSAFVDRLLSVAGQAGLCQPLPATDPVHFELCGVR